MAIQWNIKLKVRNVLLNAILATTIFAWQARCLAIRNESSRRLLLKTSASIIPTIFLPWSCSAQERLACKEGKPCAPINALLPATRCKLWIDREHYLSTKVGAANCYQDQYDAFNDLTSTLANRPRLFVGAEKPVKRTNSISAQITTAVSTANKDQRQKNRESLNIPTQIAAMWN